MDRTQGDKGRPVKQVLIVVYYFLRLRPAGRCVRWVLPEPISAQLATTTVLTTTPDCVYPHHQTDLKLARERVPASIEVTRVPYQIASNSCYGYVIRCVVSGKTALE